MRHETVVTPVPLAELEKLLAQRWAIRWREQYPDGVPTLDDDGLVVSVRGDATKEEHDRGVKQLVEGYRAEGLTEDTAWSATCKCGWQANNPVPTKQAAEEAAEAHITSIYGEA